MPATNLSRVDSGDSGFGDGTDFSQNDDDIATAIDPDALSLLTNAEATDLTTSIEALRESNDQKDTEIATLKECLSALESELQNERTLSPDSGTLTDREEQFDLGTSPEHFDNVLADKERLREKLNTTAREHASELAKEKEAHAANLANALAEEKKANAAALADALAKAKEEHEADLTAAEEARSTELTNIEGTYAAELERVKAEHTDALTKAEEAHAAELAERKEAHEAEREKAKAEHANTLAEKRKAYGEIKKDIKELRPALQNALDQNEELMEQLKQRTTDLKAANAKLVSFEKTFNVVREAVAIHPFNAPADDTDELSERPCKKRRTLQSAEQRQGRSRQNPLANTADHLA